MAHHVYQTEALILKSANMRESNRFIDFFTRELGLVRAAAQSARKESSKMRYSLQEYSHVDVSLVRGREVWRVTGVQERGNGYYKLKGEHTKLLLLKRIHSLLSRLLHGEEKNEHLYDVVVAFHEHLDTNDVPEENVLPIETLTVLRILYHLGYVPKRGDIFDTNTYNQEFFDTMRRDQKQIVAEINDAIRESQL